MAAVTPGYRWHVGQLTTGRIWRTFDVDSGSWSTSFDYGNTSRLDFTIPVGALNSGRDKPLWPTVRADTAPPKAFAAVSYIDTLGSETFLEAGPVWVRYFNEDTGLLKVGASDLSTYMAHRKVFDWIAYNAAPDFIKYAIWTQTFTGPELGIIAKRLVELIQYDTWNGVPEDETSNAWLSLPIVLPSDADLGGTTPATYSESYFGYEMAWVHDKLRDLTERDDGPEIQFVPRRRADAPRYIEWVMRIGVASDGYMLTQSGPDWPFDYTVRKSPIRNISIREDGNNWAWTTWAGGQGQAEGRLVRAADSVAAGDLVLSTGYPFLETEVAATDSVDTMAKLVSLVRSKTQQTAAPREQWTVTVSRDDYPNVGQYRAGDTARVSIGPGHVYLPEGEYPMRIVATSGSADDSSVTLTMKERPSEV